MDKKYVFQEHTSWMGTVNWENIFFNFTFTFHFPALEKEMATHSTILAWRIPGTAEPGGLLSMGLHRVGHDWSDLALLNQTRVHSPNTQQSQSTHTRMWWKKYSIYCRAPSKEEGQLMLRWFPTPGWLSGKGFLKTEWERGSQGVWSAHAHFSDWLTVM